MKLMIVSVIVVLKGWLGGFGVFVFMVIMLFVGGCVSDFVYEVVDVL